MDDDPLKRRIAARKAEAQRIATDLVIACERAASPRLAKRNMPAKWNDAAWRRYTASGRRRRRRTFHRSPASTTTSRLSNSSPPNVSASTPHATNQGRPSMPKHRILLVEELVLSDSAEFIVDAETPGVAASRLIRARCDGLDQDSDLVQLPDGQIGEIKPQDVARCRLFCVLLDDAGNQIAEIEPAEPKLVARKAPQPLASNAVAGGRPPP